MCRLPAVIGLLRRRSDICSRRDRGIRRVRKVGRSTTISRRGTMQAIRARLWHRILPNAMPLSRSCLRRNRLSPEVLLRGIDCILTRISQDSLSHSAPIENSLVRKAPAHESLIDDSDFGSVRAVALFRGASTDQLYAQCMKVLRIHDLRRGAYERMAFSRT